MFSKQQVHVLLILWMAKRPLTHEEIERMAVLAKYDDTPQGLRTRMIELERSGHRFWFAETPSFRAGRKQTVLLSQIDMI